MTYIYALCEPGTRRVRYIGMSKDPARRLRQHISRANKGLASPLGEWVRSLSGKPNLVVLCETAEAFWQDDEKTYIRAARALGMPLVNSSEGGDGTVNPPPETRAKLSAAVSGPKNGNYGKPHSLEWKQNMSRIMTGRKHDPMSAACGPTNGSYIKAKARRHGELTEILDRLARLVQIKLNKIV